uniref:Uncharacterized protein n=1 Tax=Noccaea caerulescens TaxID=107243 RepID=A0A1J3FT07_NOCCA
MEASHLWNHNKPCPYLVIRKRLFTSVLVKVAEIWIKNIYRQGSQGIQILISIQNGTTKHDSMALLYLKNLHWRHLDPQFPFAFRVRQLEFQELRCIILVLSADQWLNFLLQYTPQKNSFTVLDLAPKPPATLEPATPFSVPFLLFGALVNETPAALLVY